MYVGIIVLIRIFAFADIITPSCDHLSRVYGDCRRHPISYRNALIHFYWPLFSRARFSPSFFPNHLFTLLLNGRFNLVLLILSRTKLFTAFKKLSVTNLYLYTVG